MMNDLASEKPSPKEKKEKKDLQDMQGFRNPIGPNAGKPPAPWEQEGILHDCHLKMVSDSC